MQAGSVFALEERDWIFPATASRRSGSSAECRSRPSSPGGEAIRRDGGTRAEFNVASICVPIATQIPHAVGFAWGSALKGEDRVALVALRRRSDLRGRVPRRRDLRRRDEGAGGPLLQQQPVGDLDPALRADGCADACRQGDRLRDSGSARRRRRRPRRVRGDAGGGRAGARGGGADLHRGGHLPRGAARDGGRPLDLHRLRARRGGEARTSASGATSATSCAPACSPRSERRRSRPRRSSSCAPGSPRPRRSLRRTRRSSSSTRTPIRPRRLRTTSRSSGGFSDERAIPGRGGERRAPRRDGARPDRSS